MTHTNVAKQLPVASGGTASVVRECSALEGRDSASQSRPTCRSLSSGQDRSPTGSTQPTAASPANSTSLQTPGLSHTTSAPSSSLQRLKSFSFVKTVSKQNGSRTREEDLARCPPAKRMLVDENGTRSTLSVVPPRSSSSPSSKMEVDDSTEQSESSPPPAHTACLERRPSFHPGQQTGARLHPPFTGAAQTTAHSSTAQGSCLSNFSSVPRQTLLSTSDLTATAGQRNLTPVKPPTQLLNTSSRKQDGFRTPSQVPRRQALSAVAKLRPQIAQDSTPSSMHEAGPIMTTPTRDPISQSSLRTPTSGSAQLRTPSSIARLLQTPTNPAQSVRRRFPGPAGLLPALVCWLTDSVSLSFLDLRLFPLLCFFRPPVRAWRVFPWPLLRPPPRPPLPGDG